MAFSDRRGLSTGCQAAHFKDSLHSRFCGFLAIQAGTKLRAVWDRVLSNFPPHPILLPSFFVKANEGFQSHALHLALKLVAYCSCVSMETDIGRSKYIVLNNFNSDLLPPSTVALKKKNSMVKADTYQKHLASS